MLLINAVLWCGDRLREGSESTAKVEIGSVKCSRGDESVTQEEPGQTRHHRSNCTPTLVSRYLLRTQAAHLPDGGLQNAALPKVTTGAIVHLHSWVVHTDNPFTIQYAAPLQQVSKNTRVLLPGSALNMRTHGWLSQEKRQRFNLCWKSTIAFREWKRSRSSPS